MENTSWTLLLGALFLIMGGVFLSGKGSWLIAGFNTMSQKEKEKWNRKALCKAMGIYMLLLSALTFFWSFIVRYPWGGRVFAACILGATAFLLIFVNTSKRFQNSD